MAKKKIEELNLAKEVKALAGHIGRALKAAKDSEELKGIKAETVGVLRNTSGRIVSAIEKAKSKPTVEKVSKNLSAGLRFVSKELEALADRLTPKGKS